MSRFRLKANLVRAVPPYWAHQPTSGEGARQFGGRFNPVGTPALYASFDVNTAAKEVRFALNRDPFTFYFLEVDCEDVLDLTDASVRSAYAVTLDMLDAPNWESEMTRGLIPDSHALANRLMADGIAAILVPSFAPGARTDDRNLVLWDWEDTSGGGTARHGVRVIGRDRLPVDASSWRK